MPQETNHGSTPTLPGWVWLGLLALSSLTFLLGLNAPLLGVDEPRYAEVAREMWQSGDLITPTLGGYHWFEKPPLLYWIENVFFNVLGVSEWSVRLGPALCGVGIVAAIWLVGRNVLGKNPGRWFALGAASTLGIIAFSHGATTDIVVTFTLTGALCSYFLYENGSTRASREWAPLVAFYIFLGLSLLAKGLIGVVLPAGTIALYCVLCRRWPSRRFVVSWAWGSLITAGIAATWYVPMYLRHGMEFIDEFIIRQHFERFTINDYRHPQPFYFYLYILPLMTLPWLPAAIRGVWLALVSVSTSPGSGPDAVGLGLNDESNRDSADLLRYGLAWMIVPLVFFSLSTSKLPGYVLPAVPGAIVLASLAVLDLLRRKPVRSYLAAGLGAATMVGACITGLLILPGYADRETTKRLFTLAAERGFTTQPVLVMHNYSHNAEYYAPGRIVRLSDGKQDLLYGSSEVENRIRTLGVQRALVVLPTEYVTQLTDDPLLKAEVIATNQDTAIVAVGLK